MSCQVKDFGYDNSCGTLSEATFMHTGYTGGCICVDPVLEAFTVILTNRYWASFHDEHASLKNLLSCEFKFKFWFVYFNFCCRVYNCQGQLCPAGGSDAVKSIFKSFNTVVATAVEKMRLE